MTTQPQQLNLAAGGVTQHVPPLGQAHDQFALLSQEAILGQFDMAVVVLSSGRVIASNTAGRRLLHAGLDSVMGERRLRHLLATVDGADTPIEQELAIPDPTSAQTPLRLRLRLVPLLNGAVLELTRVEAGSHDHRLSHTDRLPTPSLTSNEPQPSRIPETSSAARLADRIRQETAQLSRLVDDYLSLTDPSANPDLVDGLLAPTGGILRCSGVTMDLDAYTVTVDDSEPVTLPLRQFDLLKILLANAGRVVSRQQLVGLVWPGPLADESNTITAHIRRLRRLLDPPGCKSSRIVSVRKVGYMFATTGAEGSHCR